MLHIGEFPSVSSSTVITYPSIRPSRKNIGYKLRVTGRTSAATPIQPDKKVIVRSEVLYSNDLRALEPAHVHTCVYYTR